MQKEASYSVFVQCHTLFINNVCTVTDLTNPALDVSLVQLPCIPCILLFDKVSCISQHQGKNSHLKMKYM